jgi:hypothetical protein
VFLSLLCLIFDGEMKIPQVDDTSRGYFRDQGTKGRNYIGASADKKLK